MLLAQREVGAAPPFNQHMTASAPHLCAAYEGQPQDRMPNNTTKNKKRIAIIPKQNQLGLARQ
jgi:hypothetical protein